MKKTARSERPKQSAASVLHGVEKQRQATRVIRVASADVTSVNVEARRGPILSLTRRKPTNDATRATNASTHAKKKTELPVNRQERTGCEPTT